MTEMDVIRAIITRLAGFSLITIFALAHAAYLPALAQSDPKVLDYKGTVAAAREAEVAPRLDGLLTTIHFSAGQVVKKGDLLFEFGAKSAELSLALAQAHLKQAEAQLRLAETNLKNKQTLRTRNVASEMQFLDAEAQRDIAGAKVDEARANVELGQISLQQMKLYAPITGIISRAFIREGAYITKEARDQSRLATIIQLDPIHVVGQAPAAAYFQRSDKAGEALKTLVQTAEQREFALVLPTGDKYPHLGRLVAGAYEFNLATQTTEVIVEFPNPDYLLRPGLNVTIQSSIRPQ
jgi:RND family efflux transporter MFP subunit